MTTTTDFAAYEAKCAAFNQRCAEIAPGNRAALFAALRANGIQTVVVTFDGSGDSGQIETIDGFSADGSDIKLPNVGIAIQETDFDSRTISVTHQTARVLIEAMSYDLLGQTHGGWENDDGAYGEFTFSVPEQSITLDYNERFTDSTSYQHAF